MVSKRIVLSLLIFGSLSASAAWSRKSDPDALARLGRIVGDKMKGTMPDGTRIAGPFMALKPGDALTLEEKVRVRIRTDKRMSGADVTILVGAASGEVKLRGQVKNGIQAARAVELAEGTTGVEKVIDELTFPE